MLVAEIQAGPSASPDARLVEIFHAMEAARIRYCMLRGYELLWRRGSKEIDILVLPEHMRALRDLLRARGFATLPAWGHAPHHFFVSYNPADDSWLKLDIVDAVRYGTTLRVLEVDITQDILRNRQRYPYTYMPAPEEECLKLLLHCLLHKQAFTPEKSARLLELLRLIRTLPTASRNLIHEINANLSPVITTEMLDAVADTGECDPLLQRREQLIKLLFWKSPLKNSWRWLTGITCLKMRAACIALFRRGITVALLAPDGAGKSTLAARLAADPFIAAQVVYMGTNSDAQSRKFRLASSLRAHLHRGNTNAANPWYGLRLANFLLSLGEHWYRIAVALYHKLRGRFVVFDRYMYDAWLNPHLSRRRLRDRLFELPWPRPDMVFVLDAPGQVLYERKHEHSPEWLEHRRREYLQLKERLPGAVYVDAARPQSEVQAEIISLIWKQYAKKELR